MTDIYTLEDLDLASLRGTAVFVRVDFNVPLADGEVLDDTRLREALPTLHELRAAGARLVLASHCGRPKGSRRPEYSLRPAADRLGRLLDVPVAFADSCVGEAATSAVAALGDGEVLVLENLRFEPGETANDGDFAARLASLAQVYVNDAFGTAHRAHASVVGVAERLPRRAAGRLLVRELEALGRLLAEPERPFAAVLGGAKIKGKLGTLENLLPRLDRLIVGGGMANTFLASGGLDLAGSLVETESLELARELLAEARRRGVEVFLPTDLVITDSLADPRRVETVAADAVPAGTLAVDIGEASRAAFAAALAPCRTVFWNGPQGVFETPPFDAGTCAVADAVAAVQGFKVIGGGETVAAARRAGVAERIEHVSTGGGASLELLAGDALPGVAALARGGAS